MDKTRLSIVSRKGEGVEDGSRRFLTDVATNPGAINRSKTRIVSRLPGMLMLLFWLGWWLRWGFWLAGRPYRSIPQWCRGLRHVFLLGGRLPMLAYTREAGPGPVARIPMPCGRFSRCAVHTVRLICRSSSWRPFCASQLNDRDLIFARTAAALGTRLPEPPIQLPAAVRPSRSARQVGASSRASRRKPVPVRLGSGEGSSRVAGKSGRVGKTTYS